jgi:hypothetical protein
MTTLATVQADYLRLFHDQCETWIHVSTLTAESRATVVHAYCRRCGVCVSVKLETKQGGYYAAGKLPAPTHSAVRGGEVVSPSVDQG